MNNILIRKVTDSDLPIVEKLIIELKSNLQKKMDLTGSSITFVEFKISSHLFQLFLSALPASRKIDCSHQLHLEITLLDSVQLRLHKI